MMRIIAGAILTIMILPVFAWAGITIIDHGQSIARLDERERSTKELLIELTKDVKYIRKNLAK